MIWRWVAKRLITLSPGFESLLCFKIYFLEFSRYSIRSYSGPRLLNCKNLDPVKSLKLYNISDQIRIRICSPSHNCTASLFPDLFVSDRAQWHHFHPADHSSPLHPSRDNKIWVRNNLTFAIPWNHIKNCHYLKYKYLPCLKVRFFFLY